MENYDDMYKDTIKNVNAMHGLGVKESDLNHLTESKRLLALSELESMIDVVKGSDFYEESLSSYYGIVDKV